jgi:zinc transport system substrate-binding protein
LVIKLVGVVVAWLLAIGITFSGAAERMPICVSIPPQKYFVEKIGGDLVEVSVIVQPGANPHNYEPRPTQMVSLAKARAYFAIGITFESSWLKKISATNRKMAIYHTEEGVDLMPMDAHYHSHEADRDEHRGGAADPHIWLSPPEVKIQAANILRALKKMDSPNSAQYEANYRGFLQEIESLDAELRMVFAGTRGMKFMVYHPAWGYFARAYGLKQVPVELEGKEPKPSPLRELIGYARKEGIRVLFVQPQFSTKSAETIAGAIGGQVVFADPLGFDWARDLREIAEKFRSALK